MPKEKHWSYDSGFKLSNFKLLQKKSYYLFKKDRVLVEVEKTQNSIHK